LAGRGGSVNGLSHEKFNYHKYRMLLESKLNYYRKWYPGPQLFLFKILFLFQIFAQFLKGKMGGNLRPLLSIYCSIVLNSKGDPKT
jgi:hypothetical protein